VPSRRPAARRPGAVRNCGRSVSVREVFRTDLTLLHAPSVYDFRTSVIMHGPIADAVPSTNEFEMYPVGLTSIALYLSANHYNVRIVNLAYLMLAEPRFDVEAYVARLHPKVFGIESICTGCRMPTAHSPLPRWQSATIRRSGC